MTKLDGKPHARIALSLSLEDLSIPFPYVFLAVFFGSLLIYSFLVS
jgi:hypothetical protein